MNGVPLFMIKGRVSEFKDGSDENTADKDTASNAIASSILRHNRRLSDKLFVAFHQACDTGELDVAQQLLGILEKMIKKPRTANEGNRRRNIEGIVAAFERLWYLRRPER